MTQYAYDALGRQLALRPDGQYRNPFTTPWETCWALPTDRATTICLWCVQQKIGNGCPGQHSHFDYDWKEPDREIDKRGASTHYVYDAMDTDERRLGFYENYTYDANGNMIQKQDKLGNFDPPMMHLVEKQKIPYNIAIKYHTMPKAAQTVMTGWGIRLFTNTMPGATRSCIGRWRFDTRYGYDSVGNLVSGTRFREHALLHSTKALMDLGLKTDLQHCKVG